ncbi:MAG TPA: sigma-70 family RNA polymerase sigma factor [Baekduia sp.]|nr:sigma-70 family RNA polymerase sigma factor [Baekduia sp.]
MQPPTDTPHPNARGDEDELYRRHHRELHHAVTRAVQGPRELIEDACQTAWAILLRRQPDRDAIFAWLRVVAVHEAYRLSAINRRDARLERLHPDDGEWHDVIADPRSLDDSVEALEALRALASLPERRRIDLALKVAGYSYEEIRAQRPGRTRTNVNKSLVKTRARIRRIRPPRSR